MSTARLSRPAGDAAGLELPLRLTLIHLLLRPMGPWPVRVAVLGLAAAGLVAPRVLVAPATWLSLALLAAARLVVEWPLPDNHIYLLAYWCAAAGVALLLPDPPAALARSSRALIGLLFACAVVWKAGLSHDYLDGRFFRVTLLTDERFADTARLVGGLTEAQLDENRRFLTPLPAGAALLHPPRLVEPPRLRAFAWAATWCGLGMEAALALLYLLPRPRGDGLRHLALLAFCAVTYALAPVAGFGWLLLVMGLANAEPRRHRLRRVYVAAFLLVLVYAEVPWADAALRLFPTPPD
jgi:hypothetical protein